MKNPGQMSMLIEILNVSQPANEPPRRCFASDDLDLTVWYDASRQPSGFQLCYDKGRSEHALTWQPGDGFSHRAVDDGDSVGGKHKPIAIMTREGPFSVNRVAALFVAASGELPEEIARFVTTKLRQHPDWFQAS